MASKRILKKLKNLQKDPPTSCSTVVETLDGCLKMLLLVEHSYLVLLYAIGIVTVGPSFSRGSMIGSGVLHVGKELWRETMPLQSGSKLYKLEGIKPHIWYEVKISYPASIPATFSLQLKHGDNGFHQIRRLLNTEKLIFKTDSLVTSDKDCLNVLVTVEPEGVVAIPNVEERDFVVYNIVCDELFLGIPYKAWLVVALVLLCLMVSLIVPRYFPSHLLPEDRTSHRRNHSSDKHS